MNNDPLMDAATAALSRAYCPYSGFAVGAAVQSDDGRIFTGVNVENASYGLTVCAERHAVAAAVNAGVRRLSALAVVTRRPGPVTPCGACLQVLAEFAPPDMPIRMASAHAPEPSLQVRLRDLLPVAFQLQTPRG